MELQSRKLLHFIHKPLVEEYKQWRYDEHDIEAVTLRHDLLAWSRFFNWAVDQSYLLVNPFLSEKIKIPSDKNAVCQYVLTPEELKCYFGGASLFRNLFDQGIL